MLHRISRLLDQSGDEFQEQRRLYLTFLLLILTIFLATSPRRVLGDVIFFGFIGLLLALLAFTYWGKLWPARVILPLSAYLLITWLVYLGSIYDEAVGGYYLLLAVAGLMIGRRALLFFGGLSALTVLLLGFAEMNRWIHPQFAVTPELTTVLTTAFFLLATTFGLNHLVVRLNHALHEARQHALAQTQANEELRALEITLEKRIEERTAELDFANRTLIEQFERINNLQARLRQEAIRDSLTTLFNRRYLDETLPVELARAYRANLPITFLMVDVDHFKMVNDEHGHQVGDVVLQMVGYTLKDNVRIGDIVCRYGGEEFLLVLPGMKDNDAHLRAETLRKMVSTRTVMGKDAVISVTISIGGSIYPKDGLTSETLIFLADAALYQAKQSGRNRVEFASEPTAQS